MRWEARVSLVPGLGRYTWGMACPSEKLAALMPPATGIICACLELQKLRIFSEVEAGLSADLWTVLSLILVLLLASAVLYIPSEAGEQLPLRTPLSWLSSWIYSCQDRQQHAVLRDFRRDVYSGTESNFEKIERSPVERIVEGVYGDTNPREEYKAGEYLAATQHPLRERNSQSLCCLLTIYCVSSCIKALMEPCSEESPLTPWFISVKWWFFRMHLVLRDFF